MKIKLSKNKNTRKIKGFFVDMKKDPRRKLVEILNNIKLYLSTNILFCSFVVINVVNSFLLRFLTVHSMDGYTLISPIIADIAIMIIIGSFGYLFKLRKRIIYWYVVTFICTAICIINSAYYTFYTSFSSISLLSTTKFIVDVGDAVVENVVKIKDFTYLILPICYIFLHVKLRKKGYFENISSYKSKKKMKNTIITGFIFALLFATTLTGTDIGRITKQWNRESVVMKYGIYIYHINDLIKSVEPKISTLFGYDNALKKFDTYFENVSNEQAETNMYTGILEGKNVLVIHWESMQSFLVGLKINGVEVTPNLNKLVNKGMYFENFYSQVSVGTSSDTEFTFSTSLMPSNMGTAFGSYFDRTYITTQNILANKGYYTFSMHGNNADYWNRRIMYKSIGYKRFYSKIDFEIDEKLGLGLSDKSFFRQAISYIEEIKSQYNNYFGTMITLTNHTPFNSKGESYSDFDVSLKIEKYNKQNNKYEVVTYPYMEDTKLGYYLQSAHYADEALGEFISELENKNLLENTVLVIYGDHDARLPIEDYIRLYNYDYENDAIYSENSQKYHEINEYDYILNRKVPLILWSEEVPELTGTITEVMGMYDLQPTLGNMMGFYNKYALGNDIFKEEDNIVVFPDGNWLTNKVYYNSQREEPYIIGNKIVLPTGYIEEKTKYAEDLLDVSNAIIVFDLLGKTDRDKVNEQEIIEEGK